MRRIRSASFAALTFAGLLAVPLHAQNAAIGANDAADGIRVRVGVPYVARGPGAIADSWFTEFKLPGGRYRGFTALGSTLAIDGKEPYSMGGPGATVLKPGGQPIVLRRVDSACGASGEHTAGLGPQRDRLQLCQGADARFDDIRQVVRLWTDLEDRGTHHHRNGSTGCREGNRRQLSDRDQG